MNSKFISTNGDVKKYSDRRFSPASKGDILMVMSDVPNGRAIARCFLVDCDDRYTVNQRICALQPLQINERLLTYKLDRNPYYLTFDDGVKQTNLRKNDVLSCPLALPPTKVEQDAIAQALCDADALIESLEQLLAKKRHLKQGAMQELLTGKKRLPGFKAEWQEQALFDLAGGRKELFDDGDWIESEHITDQGIRLVQTGNIGVGSFIERDEKKYIFEKSFVSLRCKEIRQGDLLICRLADPAGRSCILPNIGEAKIITSVDVTIFRPPAAVANRVFLANMFSTDKWFRAVGDRSGGTTHKRISRGALGRLKNQSPVGGGASRYCRRPLRYGCGDRCAGGETRQSPQSQAGHDAGAAHREDSSRMSYRLSESAIVSAVAEEAAQRITRKVIAVLQDMNDTLSGDDSELETTWDEICVQVQDEESVFWDVYDEIVRDRVRAHVAELPKFEREAIWLQTDAGIDWACDEPEDRNSYPIADDDIVNYLVPKYLYSQAADWSNPRIEAYFARSTERD